MKELTEKEANYIIEYTGMDLAMRYPLDETPVVYFSRNNNIIDFVTILSKEQNKS